MSSTSTIQELRERVLGMAREIEQLSEGDAPPTEFFGDFLRLLMSAVGAKAGIVWMGGGEGPLEVICQEGVAELGIGEVLAGRAHRQLLAEALATGESSVHAPDDESNGVAGQHTVILVPLHRGTSSAGLVEVFHRADIPREARSGYLHFIEQVCGFASRYLERQNRSAAPSPEQFWQDLDLLTLNLHRSLRVREVAATAVNDGRTLLGCDRVGLAVVRGRKTVIEAISGQEQANPRANAVRSLALLAGRVAATGEPLVYTGQIETLPPQIEGPLANYVQQSGARMVMVLPLREPEPPARTTDDLERAERARPRRAVIGCLIVEQMSDSRPQPVLKARADLLADHVAAALQNARLHRRILLLPLWQALGTGLEWLHGRKLLKTLLVAALLAAVGLTLALVPWDYRVEAAGRLMPVVQREVFAPWDGEVVEIYVRDGQAVRAGDPLLRIRNDDLRTQLVTAESELNEKRQLLFSLRAELDGVARAGDRDQETRLQGKIAEARVQVEGLEQQIALLRQRVESLTARSPIDGTIASFRVEQLLLQRPVRRGDVLLDVMAEEGPWRLELEVEERRMGHVLRAQRQLDEHLPLEFVLATRPEATFRGRLDSVATRSAVSEESGTVVEIHAAIDSDEPPERRIGAEVRAKINCGRRSLGYVLFGDVIEFVQEFFWL